MVLLLAGELEVPLRERNELLLAAGYAPLYGEHDLEDPAMAPVRDALNLILTSHDPHPALVVDRHWELVAANRGLGLLIEGVAPELLEPPVNALRLALHPDGMRRTISNFASWRAHLLARLERQVRLTADAQLGGLLSELAEYPVDADDRVPAPTDPADLVVHLRVRRPEGELRFLSTVATFGTPLDVTIAELVIEAFFPADPFTAEVMRAALAK